MLSPDGQVLARVHLRGRCLHPRDGHHQAVYISLRFNALLTSLRPRRDACPRWCRGDTWLGIKNSKATEGELLVQIDRRALRRSMGSRTTRRRSTKRVPFGYTLNERPATK